MLLIFGAETLCGGQAVVKRREHMRKKKARVRCATCGAEIEVPAEEAKGLHFCGKNKEDPCIMDYWQGLHLKYGTKKGAESVHDVEN